MDAATTPSPSTPPSDSVEPISDAIPASFQELLHGDLSAGAMGLLGRVVLPACVTLVMVIIAYFVAKFASRVVAAVVCQRIDQTIGKFTGKLVFYTVLVLVGLAIMQTAGVEVGGLTATFAAVIAAAGLAIGLAFQGTLANVAAGVLLLVFRPFKVNDLVSVAGVTGRIFEIDLFTTSLDTLDNRRLILPNSSIVGTTIENVTYHPHRRAEITVGIAYGVDADRARALLTAAVEMVSERIVMGEGRGYQVLMSNLGPTSVEWSVRAWVASHEFLSAKEALTTAIKRQLELHGLRVPPPQMLLRLDDDNVSLHGLDYAPARASHGTVAEAEPAKTAPVRPRIRNRS